MSRQHWFNLGVSSKLMHDFNRLVAHPLGVRPLTIGTAKYGLYLLLDDYLDQRLMYSDRYVQEAYRDLTWHPKFSDWLERVVEPKPLNARWIEEQMITELTQVRQRVLHQLDMFVPRPTYEMWELKQAATGYQLTSLGDYRIYDWHQIKNVPMV